MNTKYAHIPQALKELDQWVCIYSDSKIPMRAVGREPASSTSPETWSPFATAVQAVADGHYDNIGFVFADNNLVGIDIDAGYDEDGFVTEVAADIIGTCRSYTERSRSGRGLHVLLRGVLPFRGRNNLRGVEIYQSHRYFIMTGDVVVYDDLIANQDAIDYVVQKYFPDTTRKPDKPNTTRIYTPTWEKPRRNRIKIRPSYPRIGIGARNICLTSLAGTMHAHGYTDKQIYYELVAANREACVPPLPTDEIRTIVRSVTRYTR